MVTEIPNKELLDEINSAGMWFHAKKVGSIWAKELTKPQVVQTMEGETKAKAGDYVCRGPTGELWPQSSHSIHSKYLPTGETDGDGWQKFAVRDKSSGVMAARMERPFQVKATWGTLSGKKGDYVVKNYDDRNVEYPEDIWVVDQKLFTATYTEVD